MEATLENYSKEELIALIQKGKEQIFSVEQKASILEEEKVGLEKEKINLEEENIRLEQEKAYLKYQIEQLKRLAYGQKRERFENRDNGQLPLPFETERNRKSKRSSKRKSSKKSATNAARPMPTTPAVNLYPNIYP